MCAGAGVKLVSVTVFAGPDACYVDYVDYMVIKLVGYFQECIRLLARND